MPCCRDGSVQKYLAVGVCLPGISYFRVAGKTMCSVWCCATAIRRSPEILHCMPKTACRILSKGAGSVLLQIPAVTYIWQSNNQRNSCYENKDTLVPRISGGNRRHPSADCRDRDGVAVGVQSGGLDGPQSGVAAGRPNQQQRHRGVLYSTEFQCLPACAIHSAQVDV